jgi:hypothetical protein
MRESSTSIERLMASSLLGLRSSLEAVGGRRKLKKQARPLAIHPEAVPAPFRGKINFRRSDARHQQHPGHMAYMRTMRRLQKQGHLRGSAAENHRTVLETMANPE